MKVAEAGPQPWRRRPWRLIRHGAASGARNMAVDEAIQTACARGLAGPTLRFYAWSPAALSIGYFQPVSEVDLEACRARGIDLVRRPTGGRAILHDRELTYSVAMAGSDLPGGVLETYRLLSAGLHRGLLELGIPAVVSGAKEPVGSEMKRSAGGSAACFDTASSYELEVGGRKVAGSAQTRRGGAILQHGSLPLFLDGLGLFSLLALGPEKRERLAGEFKRQAIDLFEAAGRPVAFDEARAALERGLAVALGIEFEPGELTAVEEELAADLETSKFAHKAYTFKR